MKLFNKQSEEPPDPEIMEAYNKAKKERRIENAKRKGQIDADRLANQKPFYQKVMGALVAVGKDLVENAPKTDPSVLFNWDEPGAKRKKKRVR